MDESDTLRTILSHYERSAEDWVHPGRGERIRDLHRGARVVERWHEYLQAIAERFDPKAHDEPLSTLVEALGSGPDAYRRAGRAIGAYLWELYRRDDERIAAPDVLRTLKPAYRLYLEPLFRFIEPDEH
jgi:hypothetical protein